MLGPIPLSLACKGSNYQDLFDHECMFSHHLLIEEVVSFKQCQCLPAFGLLFCLGRILHFGVITPYDLLSQLVKLLKFPANEAKFFISFLESMLVHKPKYRPSAAECLQHPWMTGEQGDLLEGRFFHHQYHQVPPTDIEALLQRGPRAAGMNASEEHAEQEPIRQASGGPLKKALYNDFTY